MAKPLQKRKKTRHLYVRPSAVESEIDGVLAQGFAEAIRRARVKDPASLGFLRPESLVHLIREAARAGKAAESQTLLLLLLGRCEANLRGVIKSYGVPNPEELRQDILQHFAMMFAQDAVEGEEKLDFFECRFNRAFRALRIGFYNYEAALTNRTAAELQEDSVESVDDDQEPTPAQTDFWRASRMESRIYARQVAEFLQTLPERERRAVIMCRLWGLTQEEVARRLGVKTVRTVYNLLKRADEKLSTIKEDL